MADKPAPQQLDLFLDDPTKAVQTLTLDTPVGAAGEPPKPKILNPFYEASQLDQAGQKDKAKQIYLQLLDANFDNTVLCAALGMLYCTQQSSGIAKVLLDRALAGIAEGRLVADFKALGIIPKAGSDADLAAFVIGKRAEILNALGTCFKHENQTAKARELFEQSQSLVPPNADIQNNLATLYVNEGRPEKALQYLEEALRLEPAHAQARWNRALAWLELGDYAKGFPEYDAGFDAKVRSDRSYSNAPIPRWDGTPGKRLIVFGEQGIGDEIMFASMLPDLLRDCPDIVLECHRNLHVLFAASFPNLDIYPTREDPLITWPLNGDGSPRYQFDARVAMGSLGRYYRKTLDDFPGVPYLKPSGQSEAKWAARLNELGGKPKIGISWIGGHKRTRMEVRSLELAAWKPIFEAAGDRVDWISLQYTPAEHEIEAFKADTGITVHHWPEAVYTHTYDETAGLVSNLDLVISVCTSVIHLSGAIGVPCWVMTPSRPAWRYRLDLDYMPWYGRNNTLFRQAPGSTDWAPVVEEVAANLHEMLQAIAT